jgi:hypothetical protein
MHYVRKLGFEESPDYDFLRELFTKVLKNIGEQDDSIFDWMLINNGKGWEAGNVKSLTPIVEAYLKRIFPDACTEPRERSVHRFAPQTCKLCGLRIVSDRWKATSHWLHGQQCVLMIYFRGCHGGWPQRTLESKCQLTISPLSTN